MSKNSSILISLISCFLLSSCQSSNPKSTSEKFLTAVYRFDFEKAENYATPETQKFLKLMYLYYTDINKEQKTEAAKIEIDITDVNNMNDSAIVSYHTSVDESIKTLHLYKKNESWLVNWSSKELEQELGFETVEATVENNTIDSSIN